MDDREPSKERWLHWGKLGGAALVGAAVALIALILVPPEREQVGPVTVSAKALPGRGQTDLHIPPFGNVRANTHTSPLAVEISIIEVDVQRLGREVQAAVGDDGYATRVEEALRDLAVSVAVRSIVAALIAGAVAAAILPHRRWRYVWPSLGGALVTVVVAFGLTAFTFKVEAFEQPRFTGALTRAPVVINALNDRSLTIGEVRDRFENAATRLTDLLTVLAEPSFDPSDDTTAFLHVSDIHSNPIGLEIARQLAEQFEVEAIIDTGDLTNFGLELETEFAKLVRDMPAPYYFVSGNHDSVEVQATLQELSNVTVVHGREVEIAGIEFFGWPDPTYSNWNLLPPSQAAEIRVTAGEEVADAVAEADPDVLLVHDRRLAEEAIGYVPLILSGHYHKQIVEESNGTRTLVVGSTGAAGLQTFTTKANIDYEAEIVYFREGTAVAIDYVRFSGLGGDFVIERETLDRLPEPSPPPTPTATPSPEEDQ